MFVERTTVGLDVHSRSVVAEAVDWSTGQAFSERLVPTNEVVLGWVARPPGDRVKTDRRDARRLARLLHIGEVSGIRVHRREHRRLHRSGAQ
jgi:hypothetical protein